MIRKENLTVKAGSRALEILKDEGLRPDRIKILVGASGGPKWLVLSGMDLVLADIFKERKTQLYCMGSSIGSWRFAALAQQNPKEAIRAFEDAYIHQQFEGRPGIEAVTKESRRIMASYILDDQIEYMLNHPFMRLAFFSVRSKKMGGSDRFLPLGLYLAGAALANAVKRKFLSFFFERILFHTKGFDHSLLGQDDFKSNWVRLSESNFRNALLSSGSIPLVMQGVQPIQNAPAGTYRDGGVIDYHMNLAYQVADDELVFMPHFFKYLIPGWFDKKLAHRGPVAKFLKHMVIVSPKEEFIAALPGKKVPDRDDFKLFFTKDRERFAQWKKVVEHCRGLGDELGDLFSRKYISAEPLNE